MVQEISVTKSQNQYIIPHQRKNTEKELNMQAKIKTKNRKELKIKTLMDSGCTYMGIDKQLVKNERIKTKPVNFSFEVFNADREVTRIVPLKVEINRHKKTLEAAVTDLNSTDMFLEHDWLVKHSPKVN